MVARRAAERREDPTMPGLAVWGDGLVLLAFGDFELARAELDAVTMPTNSPESMQVAGMLALCRALVAAADQRPADAENCREWPTARWSAGVALIRDASGAGIVAPCVGRSLPDL